MNPSEQWVRDKRRYEILYWYNLFCVKYTESITEDAFKMLRTQAKSCMEYTGCKLEDTIVYKECEGNKDLFLDFEK